MAQHNNTAPPKQIGVRAFRGNLSAFLHQVSQGESLLIMSHNKVLAELRPPPREPPHRQPGALRGKIRLADDFDTMPADILAAMEGDDA